MAIVASAIIPQDLLMAQVYPGDANSDGQVDQYDILFIGYAFGETGPSRPFVDNEFSAQEVIFTWPKEFPTGANFIHADGSGNGQVGIEDLALVSSYFGESHTNAQGADLVIVPGISPLDVSLKLLPLSVPDSVYAGVELLYSLELADPEGILNDFQGIAFDIEMEGQYFSSINLNIHEESWLTDDGQSFPLQKMQRWGQVQAAVTRFGQNGISGNGSIGTLSMIVEDDLIGLLPVQIDSLEVKIKVQNILLIDTLFNQIDVQSEDLHIMLRKAALTSVNHSIDSPKLKVYPNPSNGIIQLFYPRRIENVYAYDITGHRYAIKFHNQQCQLPSQPGWYLLEVITSDGVQRKRVLVQSP